MDMNYFLRVHAYVLYQLLKAARSVIKGEEPSNDTTTILTNFHKRSEIGAAFDILSSDEDLVAAYAWRTSFLTFDALKQRDEQKKSWNDLLVDFYRLSKAHSQYLVVKNFYVTLNSEETKSQLDADTLAILRNLFRLYALHTLETESSEFYMSGAATVRQIRLTRSTVVLKLLKEIRPHAVRLVDAWDFPDWQLDSSLGRKDGNVYQDMFHRASALNPLNEVTIDPYPDSPVLFKDTGNLKSKL
jgi:acyl-CoA oxidase